MKNDFDPFNDERDFNAEQNRFLKTLELGDGYEADFVNFETGSPEELAKIIKEKLPNQKITIIRISPDNYHLSDLLENNPEAIESDIAIISGLDELESSDHANDTNIFARFFNGLNHTRDIYADKYSFKMIILATNSQQVKAQKSAPDFFSCTKRFEF
ncbi:MAG: hypothetical protein WCO23_00905 [bacterium]